MSALKNYLFITILTILAGFLVVQFWPSVFIILALIIGTLFALRYPEKALLILIFYLPFQFALNISPGIDLASGRVLILALFGIWFFKSLAEKKIIIAKNIQSFLLLLFLFFALFSFLQAWDLERATRKFLVFLSIFPLYFLVTALIFPNPLSNQVQDGRLLRKGKISLTPFNKEGINSSLSKERQGEGRRISNFQFPISNYLNIIFLSAIILSVIGIVQFILQFTVGIDPIINFWRDNIASIFYGRSFGAEVVSNPSWLVNIGGATILRSFSLFPDPHMFSFYLGLIIPILLVFLIIPFSEVPPLAKKDRGISGGGLFSFRHTPSFRGEELEDGLPRADLTHPPKIPPTPFYKGGILQRGIILLLTFLILLTAELLTFSRGGYLGMIFGMGAVIILGWRFINFNKKIFLGIISAALILFILFAAQPILSRFISIADLSEGSNFGRLAIWREAAAVWQNNFFWGVGLGNYSVEISPAVGYRAPIYAHNTYLDIAAEMGVFALLVWVGLFLITLAQLFRRSRTADNNFIRALSIGLCGSLIWFSVHCFFETPIYSPRILAILMVILALSAIVVKLPIAKNRNTF